MVSFFSGYVLGVSLILAIGAQNAFVLKQGLLRQHVLAVVLFCGISDAVLIAVGVAGFGTLARAVPWFEDTMRWAGALFLLWYGWRNAKSAWAGGAMLEVSDQGAPSLRATLGTLALLTYLNPHVYLDTVALIGAISAQYPDRLAFGIGAALGSVTFFAALGFGARLLEPVFRTPRAWQVLDGIIALTMWAIALGLVLG